MNARHAAVLIIRDLLLRKGSLQSLASHYIDQLEPGPDRAFARELAFGTMRYLPRLEWISRQLLQKPLKSKDVDIFACLLCGFYQLAEINTAQHAAVSETANIARALDKEWAVRLINGVMRNFLRQHDALTKELDRNEPAKYCLPRWILKELKQAWPQHWQEIADASLQRPPLTLRINLLKTTRDDYLQEIHQKGLESSAHSLINSAITLTNPIAVDQIPGFLEGFCSVQDAGAQFAASLLGVEQGMRVLDACSAPGGKAAHILEQTDNKAELTALDIEESRCARIQQNFQRLDLHGNIQAADAANIETWWDGNPFDRILLDAPCSATGILRRQPDIRWNRQPSDIEPLTQIQHQLLDALWHTLKPGGLLVYCTCSILPEENDKLVANWLSTRKDVAIAPIECSWGHALTAGVQILPGEYDMDGFYYARLRKC